MNNAAEDDLKIKKKQWQKVDDAKLRQLIQKNGTRNWSLIAEAIPGRTGKQCRERWHNHLDASIVKADWSAQEDEIIETMQKKLGNQWAKITKLLPGRTDNAVKNRFHLTKRARIRFLNRTGRNSNISTEPESSTIYNVIPSESEDNIQILHRQPLSRSISVSSHQAPMNRSNIQESTSAITNCVSIKNEFPQTTTASAVSQNKSTARHQTGSTLRPTNNTYLFPNVPYNANNQTEYNNNNNGNTKSTTNPYFHLPNPVIISSSNVSNVTPPIVVPTPVYLQQPPRILTYFQSDYDLDCVSIESTDELDFDINCFNHHEELRQHCCDINITNDNYTPKYYNGNVMENCLLPPSTIGYNSLSESEW